MVHNKLAALAAKSKLPFPIAFGGGSFVIKSGTCKASCTLLAELHPSSLILQLNKASYGNVASDTLFRQSEFWHAWCGEGNAE